MSRSLNEMTLREKCRDASRLVKELADHLERGFLPKVHTLYKLSRPHSAQFDATSVRDVTIRTQAAAVLEADLYSTKLDEEVRQLFAAIGTEVDHLVNTGST